MRLVQHTNRRPNRHSGRSLAGAVSQLSQRRPVSLTTCLPSPDVDAGAMARVPANLGHGLKLSGRTGGPHAPARRLRGPFVYVGERVSCRRTGDDVNVNSSLILICTRSDFDYRVRQMGTIQL